MSANTATSGAEHRRVAVVASELLGRPGTGGAGTADSLLAVALARHGHPVDLVIASGRDIGQLNPEWTSIYDSAGVRIRILERMEGVRPEFLRPPFEVFRALRELQPDVAIVNDWRGLGWAALRARQTGLDLPGTAFVVHCHGPGRVLVEFAQKVPDTLERFGESVAERACFELADAVVSPSEWLVGWLRQHRWPVPDTVNVIQYIRRSEALDEVPAPADDGAGIRRLAFFGQLREGKGIRIYLAALQNLPPKMLDGVELLFLGSASKRWPLDAIVGSLPAHARAAARIEPDLTREAALDELRSPGTLAVMPSLLDNSPNTVAECIEHGIPFVATDTGGIAELVAEEDRARVLCRPNADDLASALERAMSGPGFAPAQPARAAGESLRSWLDLVASVEPARPPTGRRVGRVALVASGEPSLERARALAAGTEEVDVVEAGSRREGLGRTAAEWVVFLDDEDEPDEGMLDALIAAQTATGADVVTTTVRDGSGGIRLFLGDPGALGLVENHYGVVGLVRASLAVSALPETEGPDCDWPLLARLVLGGARVVSIPEPLSAHRGVPGKIADVPGPGLDVLEAFEVPHVADLRDLPQLAATLGAALERTRVPAAGAADGNGSPGFFRRVARKVMS